MHGLEPAHLLPVLNAASLLSADLFADPEDVTQSIVYLGGKPRCYFMRRDTHLLCYWDGLYYTDIPTLSYDYWTQVAPPEYRGFIGRMAQHYAALRQTKHFCDLFILIDARVVLAQFYVLLPEIPARDRCACFDLALARADGAERRDPISDV